MSVATGLQVFRLYDTDILITDGINVRFDTGGWKTKHTKNCMNDNLPVGYRVVQKDFEWYVETPNQVFEYQDKMIIDIETAEVYYE